MSGPTPFASPSSSAQPPALAPASSLVPATFLALLALVGNGLAGCAGASMVSPGSASGGATGGATGGGGSGSGGMTRVTIDPISAVPPANVDAAVTTQVVGCDGGDGCVCATLRVAVVGKAGVWGDGSQTAFQEWLNSSSAGTAKVDDYPVKPTFTVDFLAQYNLIILAGLGDDTNNGPWWTFSATEAAMTLAHTENLRKPSAMAAASPPDPFFAHTDSHFGRGGDSRA